MASRISPYVDNTGLVFAYDLANVQRSYLGQPATNLITSGLPGYFGSGGETLYQQSLLGLTSDSGVFQRNYITSPNSGNNGGLYKNFTTSALNAATRYVQISFDFYMITRYRTFSSSGVGLNGYIGITNTDSTTDTYGWDTRYCNGSGDDWSNDEAYVGRWQKVSLIAALRGDKNPASIHAMYIYYDFFTQGEGIFTNFIITETPTLPTGPVRYTAGTRSVTQGLKDLTGRSTIDLTNVSFDANAQMTFDGTNDYVNLGSYLHNIDTSTLSIEIVFKTNVVTGNALILLGWHENEYPHGYICLGNFTGYWGNETISFYNEGPGTTALSFAYTNGHSLLSDTLYHHVVFILQTNNYKIYIDGVEVAVNASFRNGSQSTVMPSNLFGYGTTPSVVLGAGSDPANSFFNGNIPITKIYNRALPASEIQQNFNAIKGRYGL